MRLALAGVLSATLLTACGGEGSDVNCSLDACTVAFDRNAEGNASVLGVEAKLVSVDGDQATVEVAGQQLTLTTGQAATEVSGLQVTLQSVTDTLVTIKISR